MFLLKDISEQTQYKLTILLSVIVCVFFPLNIINLISHYWVNIPFWDEWDDTVPLILHFYAHKLSLAEIITPHNLHRLVWTRLISLLNAKFFYSDTSILLGIQILVQATSFLLLTYQLQKIFSIKTKTFWLLLMVFSALLFAPGLGQIWVWSYLVQHILTALFFMLAIFTLDLQKYKYKNLMLALIFALMASYASLNGLIIWPTLIALQLLRKIPWQQIFLTLLIGIFVIVCYYRGLDTQLNFIQANFLTRIHYFFCFIGSIFSGGSIKRATIIGILAFLLYIGSAVFVFRNKHYLAGREQLLVWYGIGILTIGSAVLGAMGRIDAGIAQALSDRYLALSAPFWIGLIVNSAWIFKKSKLHHYKLFNIFIVLLIALLSFQFVLTGKFEMRNVTVYQQWVDAEAFALEHNAYIVNRANLISYLYPHPLTVLTEASLLKQHNLFLFKHNDNHLIGSNIKNLNLRISAKTIPGSFDIDKITNATMDTCAATFMRAFSVNGVLPLNSIKNKKLNQIYILDFQGKIYGLGIVDFVQDNPDKLKWSGFVTADTSGKGFVKLKAYVKLGGDDNLYPLPTTQVLPRSLECSI